MITFKDFLVEMPMIIDSTTVSDLSKPDHNKAMLVSIKTTISRSPKAIYKDKNIEIIQKRLGDGGLANANVGIESIEKFDRSKTNIGQ